MNILHIVDSLERGGLERFVNNLAVEQLQRGDKPAVLSLQPTNGFKAELEAGGIQVFAAKARKRFSPGVIGLVASSATDYQADVIHAHGYVPAFYAAVAQKKPGFSCPQVVTVHDMGTRLNARPLRIKFRWALKQSRQLVAVGHQVAAALTRWNMAPTEKIRVVYNGVPMLANETSGNGEQLPEARRESRARLDIQPNDLCIASVGRLVELKNHQALISVLPGLQEQLECHLHLLLIGDGPLRQALEEQAALLNVTRYVHFVGETDRVDDFLIAADLFVLPSHTEGLSMALLEAGAAGLATVATDVGGNAEIVQHEQTGLIVQPQDETALADGMLSLLQSEKNRLHYGNQAREWVKANASIQASALAYEILYRTALNSDERVR